MNLIIAATTWPDVAESALMTVTILGIYWFLYR
jgi:hypothetical protein